MSKFHHPTVSAFLRDELMEPFGLTQSAVAKAAGIPLARLNQILHGKCSISAETDLRLCRLFGLSDGFFLRWQTTQELAQAMDHLGTKLDRVKPLGNVPIIKREERKEEADEKRDYQLRLALQIPAIPACKWFSDQLRGFLVNPDGSPSEWLVSIGPFRSMRHAFRGARKKELPVPRKEFQNIKMLEIANKLIQALKEGKLIEIIDLVYQSSIVDHFQLAKAGLKVIDGGKKGAAVSRENKKPLEVIRREILEEMKSGEMTRTEARSRVARKNNMGLRTVSGHDSSRIMGRPRKKK